MARQNIRYVWTSFWFTHLGEYLPDVPKEGGSGRSATCWYQQDALAFAVTPPDNKPYKLTVCLLDFDRNDRRMEVSIQETENALGDQAVSRQEAANGVYLTWTVTGKVNLVPKM